MNCMTDKSSKCFADVSIGNCSILTQKECENCSFFSKQKSNIWKTDINILKKKQSLKTIVIQHTEEY